MDFKDKKALRTPTPAERMENPVVASLAQEAPGWYEGTLDFKRVVMVPATGKFAEYASTVGIMLKCSVTRQSANAVSLCFGALIGFKLRSLAVGLSGFDDPVPRINAWK